MCRSKWISKGKKPDIPVQATFREKVDEKRYEVLIKKTPPEKKSECSPHQKHDILCALELSSDDSADEIDSIFRFVFSTGEEELSLYIFIFIIINISILETKNLMSLRIKRLQREGDPVEYLMSHEIPFFKIFVVF